MGHRVPNHKNKCKNLHGHRYKLELTVNGEIKDDKGSSDEGMVADFGDIKEIMKLKVHDPLDHCFMIYEKDPLFFEGSKIELNEREGFFVVPFIPTAENIVYWCYKQIQGTLPQGVSVRKLRLYETPNSWAEFRTTAK